MTQLIFTTGASEKSWMTLVGTQITSSPDWYSLIIKVSDVSQHFTPILYTV